MTQQRLVRLVAPARAELIHIFREVAAGLAARFDFTYDELEDLTLAVNEACAYLLRLQPEATELSMDVAPLDGGNLSVSVGVDRTIDQTPTPDSVEWMMWHVLGALTADAALTHDGPGPTIRFVSRRENA